MPHYAGVYPAKRKDNTPYYRASLTRQGKHISLGSFETPQAASMAYLEGLRISSDPSITLMQYAADSPLLFEKWVCLLNFRDHGIYFGTPIYVGASLFSYYLSPHHILKFDLEELFYYASHKIMRRGNHYFVADYGMQLTLTSRYGIKPYGVRGVDYDFRNGDPTDFRRENLLIYNTYHGVRLEEQNRTTPYVVRIHINGNVLVGRYATAIEAAIAYNKAVDHLRQRGVTKNFLVNYIDGLSAAEYARIYHDLPITSSILEYVK